MSKGLGYLQREILATLAERPGSDMIQDGCGSCAWLADRTHDLRAVSREMASRMGGISHCNHVTEAWSAAFSRAVAKLADRGALRDGLVS